MFTRLAIAGETKTRPHEIHDPETCQKVLRLDANFLHLHAIVRDKPTGYLCCYKEEDYYRLDPCSKFGLQAYQWLSFVENTEQIFIQSRYNMGERRVSFNSLLVYGNNKETHHCF